jgi:outer membrane beta-barrel protein
MRSLVITVTVLSALAATAAPGHAADAGSEQGGVLYSVEKRDVMGSHELSVSLGTLPMDAFGKGLTLTGAYTFHFNQLIAWEIIGGTYSFLIGTGLKEELADRFNARPEEEGDLQAMINSNFVFKPLYGKLALLNDTLLAAELFFVLGPALGFFDDESSPFGGNVGVGMRLFIGKYFSLRLDIRDYVFIADASDVRNHLFLSAGLGLTFGFGDDSSAED